MGLPQVVWERHHLEGEKSKVFVFMHLMHMAMDVLVALTVSSDTPHLV